MQTMSSDYSDDVSEPEADGAVTALLAELDENDGMEKSVDPEKSDPEPTGVPAGSNEHPFATQERRICKLIHQTTARETTIPMRMRSTFFILLRNPG